MLTTTIISHPEYSKAHIQSADTEAVVQINTGSEGIKDSLPITGEKNVHFTC